MFVVQMAVLAYQCWLPIQLKWYIYRYTNAHKTQKLKQLIYRTNWSAHAY